MMENPFYKLRFSSTVCNFEIRVNDLPLFHYHDTGMITTQYPMNHLILESGPQTVSLWLYPQEGQQGLTDDSKLDIEITVQDAASDANEPQNILEFQTPAFKKGTPGFKKTLEFKSNVPYQLTGWTESLNLDDTDALEQEVITFYKNVHEILSQKDFEAYRTIYEPKLTEVDKALYSSPQQTQQEWQGVVDYLSDPKMQVSPIPEAKKMFFYGHDRVVTFLQPDFKPILYFENPEEQTQYHVPLLLHKPLKRNELEVIR